MLHIRRYHDKTYENAIQWAAIPNKTDPFGKPVVTGWGVIRAAGTVAIIAATLWILW